MRPSQYSLWLLVLVGANVTLGCDAGGLLVVENKDPNKPVEIQGHTSTELVNGGTLASNNKYKVLYTLGQPTPHQGVAKSTDIRSNGGLVGAVNGP